MWPSADYPFYTLATSGLSDLPMHLPAETAPEDDLASYLELCILLPGTWLLPGPGEALGDMFLDENGYWPIRWLKLMAHFPHLFRTWLAAGPRRAQRRRWRRPRAVCQQHQSEVV